MAVASTRDELTQLRATVAAQQARLAAQEATTDALRAELAHLQRRRRLPRRALSVLLAALLVALVPLATLAAAPFTDLDPAQATGHNPNIDAIYNVGITRGCNPPANDHYCPKEFVTREQMATFLARTAGLGGNPPVANAKTAQTAGHAATADNATNAQSATSAGHAATAGNATNAANATNAQNANTVGGYTASALNRIAFSSTVLPQDGKLSTEVNTRIAEVTLTVPGPAPQAVAVRGSFNVKGQPSGGIVHAHLRQDGMTITATATTVSYHNAEYNGGTVASTEWVFVASPGTHTYTLVGATQNLYGTLTIASTRLVATTHPFGRSGDPGATEIEPAAPPAPAR